MIDYFLLQPVMVDSEDPCRPGHSRKSTVFEEAKARGIGNFNLKADSFKCTDLVFAH